MKAITDFILWLTTPVVQLLDWCWPRRPHRILFTTKTTRFYDNPRYLFDYACSLDGWEPIWITEFEDEARRIAKKYGEKHVFLHQIGSIPSRINLILLYFSAFGVVIRGRDDLWFIRRQMTLKRRIVVDLCHGVPVKGTGILTPVLSDPSRIREEITRRRMVTYHTVASEFERYFLSASYFVDARRLPVTGDPRNDRIIQRLNQAPEIRCEVAEVLDIPENFDSIILYAPTHRDASDVGVKNETVPAFFPFDDLNVNALFEFLETHRSLLLLRTHNQDNLVAGDIKRIDHEVLKTSRIQFLPHTLLADINEILSGIDVLWTDYSGIYLDYLLCNKPIIFIPYDLNFFKVLRGLIVDYELITPGPKVTTFAALIKECGQALAHPDGWANERRFIKKLFHNHLDGNACARVMALFNAQQQDVFCY